MNFPKKTESRTTTKMHYTMSYFFENGTPPPNKHHLSTFFWETSACISTLGLEVTDSGKSAKISKAVLPKPDPQFGHFSLTLLIYEWGQRKIASRFRSGDLDAERHPPPYPQTAAFLDGLCSNRLMHAAEIYYFN